MLYLFQRVFVVIFILAVAAFSQTGDERQGIILNNQGVDQFQKGRSEDALKSLNLSAQLFPANAVVYRNLGYFYWKNMSDLDRAETAFRNAIRLKPDYAVTYNQLGIVLMEAKRPKEALETFLKADALQPNDPMILLNIGNVQMTLKDFRGATATLERARSIDLQNPTIRVSLGYAYSMRKKFDLAVAEVRYAIRIDPKDEDAQFFLGTLYLANHDKEAAMALQRTVSSLNSDLAQRLFQAIHSDMILVLPPNALDAK